MPYSSGTYSLPSGNPVVTGTTISSSTTNTTNSDIATALSTCVLKDGTQTITANLPMASHKLTGLSAGTTAGDSVEYGGSPSFTNLAYTGTLTGSTGILNIGSGQVYKDASGNVGIGTSSPSGKLHVFGSNIQPIFETSSSVAAGGVNYLNIKDSTGFVGGIGFAGLSNSLQFTTNLASGFIRFLTGLQTEAMRIDSSGNVGIGTSSPSTKLTVAGAITITGAFALRGSYGGGAISSNFAAGDNALVSNTTGSENTASGVAALYNNTTGNYNTASGRYALLSNTTGSYNTASGQAALQSNTTGYNNTASGFYALLDNSTGYNNTASGRQALYSNTTGSNNTASGNSALHSNTTGSYNTASGVSALTSNTTGISNTASGVEALTSNTTGVQNTASGRYALTSNTTGGNNTANGYVALYKNTTGTENTASGVAALYNNTTGSNNTASGMNALGSNTTGSGNSAFNPLNSAGTYAPIFDPTTENNRFCMGSTGVTNAYIQVAWTVVSDARDKTNFAPVPHGLDFVNQLQPTAYQFKEDRETDVATGIVRYGFKAQDVLALEGDTPVIIDTEDLDKLRFNSDSLIPVLVNAIKELTARLQILEAK